MPSNNLTGVVTVEQRLQLLDAIYVDQGRSMDAQESGRIEAAFERLQGLADQMGFTAYVDAHVIIGCFQPINLFYAEKEYSAGGPDDNARQVLLPRLQVFEQSRQPFVPNPFP